MSNAAVANRYAFALFQVANEKQLLNELESEFRVVRDILKQDKDFVSILSSPKLAREKKKQIIQKVFSNVNPYLMNTLLLLVDRQREEQMAQVANYFIELADAEKGVAEAKVTSVRPLTEDEKKALSQAFSAMLGKKELLIENQVDSNLLGGIKLRIGNRIYDGSLKGKLERLERQLLR